MVAVSLCALWALGCQAPQAHTWVRPPRIGIAERAEWMRLPSDHYGLVDQSQRQAAIRMLQLQPSVRLEPEDVGQWLGTAVEAPEPGLCPVLVRGVGFGSSPTWTDIWANARLKAVWVETATDRGQLSEAEFMAGSEVGVPLVAYLPCAPVRVYGTAIAGGDEIFEGRAREGQMLGGKANASAPACSLQEVWALQMRSY